MNKPVSPQSGVRGSAVRPKPKPGQAINPLNDLFTKIEAALNVSSPDQRLRVLLGPALDEHVKSLLWPAENEAQGPHIKKLASAAQRLLQLLDDVEVTVYLHTDIELDELRSDLGQLRDFSTLIESKKRRGRPAATKWNALMTALARACEQYLGAWPSVTEGGHRPKGRQYSGRLVELASLVEHEIAILVGTNRGRPLENTAMGPRLRRLVERPKIPASKIPKK